MNDHIKHLAAEIAKLDMTQVGALINEISVISGVDLNTLLQDSTSSANDQEEEKEAPKEKIYSVKLVEYDPSKKAEMIKTVRQLLGSNVSLSEVKSQIESLPCTIKKNIKEQEKNEIIELFSKTGAKLEVSED